MKIKVPEAEILRTPIKIEKLSLWNRSRSGFVMNFKFHGFLDVSTDFWMSPSPPSHHIWGSSVIIERVWSSAEPKEWRPKALYLGGSTPQPKDPDQR